MKSKSLLFIASAIIFSSLLLFSCSSSSKQENVEKAGITTKKQEEKQLNISVFIDLSSRILPTAQNPNPKERDLQISENIIQYFKQDMDAKGAYKAKGRLKFFFNPVPIDPKINELASLLSVDLSSKTNKEKKGVYEKLPNQFLTALSHIYDQSLANKNWAGSDLWRFFKKDVREHCILNGYRNILVILTDGYIYHERSKHQDGNKYSYLLGPQFQKLGLRDVPNWKDVIDKNNIGLIAPQSGLDDLEVLLLEICPEENHPNDEDILEYLLSKWFEEMGIKKYKIYSTDLPVNTKENIVRFLN